MRTWHLAGFAGRFAIFALSLMTPAALPAGVAGQQSPLPPTATPREVETYEALRAWITTQPREVRAFLAMPRKLVRLAVASSSIRTNC